MIQKMIIGFIVGMFLLPINFIEAKEQGKQLSETAAQAQLQAKVNSIIIDRIALEEKSLNDALKTLTKLSKKFDPDKKGINIILLGNVKKKNITLAFEKLSLKDAIKYLCMSAGLYYKIDSYAVLLSAKKIKTSISPQITGKLKQKLDSIIVPAVEYQNVVIPTVFKFIAHSSKIWDPQHKGVHFILLNKKKLNKKTTSLAYSQQGIPLGTVIRYICLAANLDYKVDDYVITISPKKKKRKKHSKR